VKPGPRGDGERVRDQRELQATGDRRQIPLGDEDSAFLADGGLIARVVRLRQTFSNQPNRALQDNECNGRVAEFRPGHLGARGTPPPQIVLAE
jgi:hypothetical protein